MLMRGIGLIKGAIPSEAVENRVYHNLIHPAVADAVLSAARMRQIRLGQVCVSKACGDGKNALEKEEITPSPHPAVADVGIASSKNAKVHVSAKNAG